MMELTKTCPNQINILNHALLHLNKDASLQTENDQKHYKSWQQMSQVIHW